MVRFSVKIGVMVSLQTKTMVRRKLMLHRIERLRQDLSRDIVERFQQKNVNFSSDTTCCAWKANRRGDRYSDVGYSGVCTVQNSSWCSKQCSGGNINYYYHVIISLKYCSQWWNDTISFVWTRQRLHLSRSVCPLSLKLLTYFLFAVYCCSYPFSANPGNSSAPGNLIILRNFTSRCKSLF